MVSKNKKIKKRKHGENRSGVQIARTATMVSKNKKIKKIPTRKLGENRSGVQLEFDQELG